MIRDNVQRAMPVGREPEASTLIGSTLGMSEDEKPEELKLRGGCWFRLGTCVVHIGVDPEFRPQRKAHPAFLVADLPRLAQRLESSGFAVTWDRSFPGVERFFTEDPFGNRIEFVKNGHGMSQR